MKKLIQTSVVPSGGGYTYYQKETDQTLRATNINQLFSQVVQHRKANNLPIPFNIEDEIEDYVCRNRPELCEEITPKPPTDKPLTLDSAVRLTRTLFSAGLKRADQSEADRRAMICSDCPDNVTPQGCTGCTRGIITKAISFIVGNRQTPYDSQLKSCKHCGCFNAAQIWMPLSALQKTITKEENNLLPSNCWKKI